MVVWAICTTLMGVVTSFTGLVVARTFLGMIICADSNPIIDDDN